MGSQIFGISWDKIVLVSRELKIGRFALKKMVPAVVLII